MPKKEKFPYKVNKDCQIEADGRGRFSYKDLSKLFNNPPRVYPQMWADTFALSEHRTVTIVRSGEGYMMFENARVNKWAEQRDGDRCVEEFLEERPDLGNEKIAVTIHEQDFDKMIKQQGGKLPHAVVADRLLSDMRNKKLSDACAPVSVNEVQDTIGIKNLGVISKAHKDGYIVWEDRRISEHAAHIQLQSEATRQDSDRDAEIVGESKEKAKDADNLLGSLSNVGLTDWENER